MAQLDFRIGAIVIAAMVWPSACLSQTPAKPQAPVISAQKTPVPEDEIIIITSDEAGRYKENKIPYSVYQAIVSRLGTDKSVAPKTESLLKSLTETARTNEPPAAKGVYVISPEHSGSGFSNVITAQANAVTRQTETILELYDMIKNLDSRLKAMEDSMRDISKGRK